MLVKAWSLGTVAGRIGRGAAGGACEVGHHAAGPEADIFLTGGG
jgi:hypothetical protein